MSCVYQLQILNNDYSTVKLVHQDSSISPITYSENFDVKQFYTFFNNDIINIQNDNYNLVSRTLPKKIIGILELYSKYSFPGNKRGIPGYIFRSLDPKHPLFIVHTKIKKNKEKNQLISIKFTTWDNLDKFPKGELIDIFGDYNNL